MDLSEYETGAQFVDDHSETVKALQQRLSRRYVVHSVHNRSSVIVVEGWDAAPSDPSDPWWVALQLRQASSPAVRGDAYAVLPCRFQTPTSRGSET